MITHMIDHQEKCIIEEFQGKVGYLQGLTEKIIDSTRTIDNHANVMVGLNTAVFALVISMLFEAEHLQLTMAVIAMFSVMSAVSAVFAIRLPHVIITKKKHHKSLFHARRIAEYDCAETYAKALHKVMHDEESLFVEYAREAYNLSRYYYMPKRRMLTWSRYFFIFGVVMSSVVLMVERIL